MQTLGQAKKEMIDHLVSGKSSRCPCCGQNVMVYRRKLNAGMARVLIKVYLEGGADQWVHINRNIKTASRDYSYLEKWALLTRATTHPKTGAKTSGYWRLTRLGVDFVEGRVKVPKEITIYNNKTIAVSDELVHIRQALGDKFDYDELMGR